MDENEAPKISIKGSVSGSNLIDGDHNKIEINQYGVLKPFNDKGVFMPTVRNMLFTGREDALATLAASLSSDKNVVITQAITGMGGLGKSQLALEFAYRSADNFVSAHWLNLMDPSQLNSEIAACGRKMGLLDDNAKQPDMVAETLRVWGLRGPRLLVLDNYESAADAMQTLAPLLALPTLRLLITARRAEFPPELDLHAYPLEVFTPAESVEFIRKLVKLKDDQTPDIEKLAETLGHLPLALHLAGHYLREEGITPAEYLIELDEVLAHESMQATWFAQMDIKSPTQHEQSLLGTFALSWQKVTDETAQTIFKVAGYLAPNEPIPLEIFAAVLEVDEKDRGLRKALRFLVDKVGLFTSKDGLPVIHPLLAAYGRYLDGKPSGLMEKLVDKLADLSESLINTGQPTHFAPLSLHIAITADYAEQARLNDSGTLWNNYGIYLKQIANYLGSRVAFERAIRIWEDGVGKDLKIAAGVNNLGLVLEIIGDLSGARSAFERAIRIWNANLGKNHPYIATGVNNLGLVLLALGDLDGARIAFERALNMGEAILGKDHPNVAIRVNNLGIVLRDAGDFDGARAAFERSLQMGEAMFGENHPNVAIRINNLGTVLMALGDLNGARAAFERALKIDEIAFGLAHPDVAIDVFNLGTVFQLQGEKEQARACYHRALAIYEQFLPIGHKKIKNVKAWLESLDNLL